MGRKAPPPSLARATAKAAKVETRANGEELERRLDLVEELVTRACTYREIRAACAKEWGIAARQADEYVSKVYARWRKERHNERGSARDRQVRRLMRVIRKGHESGNMKAVLGAEALLYRVEGTGYLPGDDLPKGGGVKAVFEIDVPPEDTDGTEDAA